MTTDHQELILLKVLMPIKRKIQKAINLAYHNLNHNPVAKAKVDLIPSLKQNHIHPIHKTIQRNFPTQAPTHKKAISANIITANIASITSVKIKSKPAILYPMLSQTALKQKSMYHLNKRKNNSLGLSKQQKYLKKLKKTILMSSKN